MMDSLLSLPTLLGCLIVMGIAIAIGVATYLGSHQFLFRGHPANLGDATRTLFLAVGLLVGLFLSLTFSEVVIELNTIERAVEREAVAISDVYHGLERFGAEPTRSIREDLIVYTQAVIDKDWPALANDSLSEATEAQLRKVELTVLQLEATSLVQERAWDRIIGDVDLISDYRLSRLEQALAQPPLFLVVVIFGFFVTMLCLGLHEPSRPLIVLVALYMAFVGLVIYLILAFSDPFQGAPGVDTAPLEYVLGDMREDIRRVR